MKPPTVTTKVGVYIVCKETNMWWYIHTRVSREALASLIFLVCGARRERTVQTQQRKVSTCCVCACAVVGMWCVYDSRGLGPAVPKSQIPPTTSIASRNSRILHRKRRRNCTGCDRFLIFFLGTFMAPRLSHDGDISPTPVRESK